MPFALPGLPLILCSSGQHTLSLQVKLKVHVPVEENVSTFWGWGGLAGTADPPRGFPGQAHLRSRVMAALPVGGGSARSRRNELQVPEGRGLAAVFLASVTVFPAAAAAVAPGGGGGGSGSVEAFGVWASATQLFISYDSSGQLRMLLPLALPLGPELMDDSDSPRGRLRHRSRARRSCLNRARLRAFLVGLCNGQTCRGSKGRPPGEDHRRRFFRAR